MTPRKEISAQVTTVVAKARRRDRTRPLLSPGFVPPGRTVPVRIPTASALHAFPGIAGDLGAVEFEAAVELRPEWLGLALTHQKSLS